MTNKPRDDFFNVNLPFKLGEISTELKVARTELSDNKSRLDDLTTRLTEAEAKLRSLNRWMLGLLAALILTILVFIFNVPLKNAVEWLANYRGQ